MELNPFALFKVIEIGDGIALINATSVSKAPDALVLVVADPNTCMEYMVRYVHARCQKRSMAGAHVTALYGLNVHSHWNTGA